MGRENVDDRPGGGVGAQPELLADLLAPSVLEFQHLLEVALGEGGAAGGGSGEALEPDGDVALPEPGEAVDVAVFVGGENDADGGDIGGGQISAAEDDVDQGPTVRPLPSSKGWIVSNWAWATAACISGGRCSELLNAARSQSRRSTSSGGGGTKAAPQGL